MQDGVHNAHIRDASIEIEDHGILTFMLRLDYGSYGVQGFGGYYLDWGKPEARQFQSCRWIRELFAALDVRSWDAVRRQPVRARIEKGMVVAIGHYLDDRWFEPRKLFAEDQ